MSEEMEQEERLQRALKRIAAATPPEGMESRITTRVRARRTELGSQKRRWPFGIEMKYATAAAAVMLVVSIAAVHRHREQVKQIAVAPMVPASTGDALDEVAAGRNPHAIAVAPMHVRKRTTVRATAVPLFQNPPPLPLTEQEQLLLTLAQRPQLLPQLKSIAHTETMANNGIGKNSIFELSTQPLQPMQPASLGDFE